MNWKRDPREERRPYTCGVCGKPIDGVCCYYLEVYGEYELKRFAHVACYRANPEPPAPLGPPEELLVQLVLFGKW